VAKAFQQWGDYVKNLVGGRPSGTRKRKPAEHLRVVA
jgi:hypothetical protein